MRFRRARFENELGRDRPWHHRRPRSAEGDPFRFADAVDVAGDQGDEDSPRGVLVTLPADLADWATERAAERGSTVSDVVCDALEIRAALEVAPQLVDLVKRG